MSGVPPPVQLSGFVLQPPSIVDFLTVCRQLPADERQQLEAFEGASYVPDEAAVRFAATPGPRWALVEVSSRSPIIIGGFHWVRAGVWQDWLLSTPAAWERHWRAVSKVCRRIIDRLLGNEANRVQCITLASRTRACEWYRLLKYEREGILRGFGAGGEDAVIYARTARRESAT